MSRLLPVKKAVLDLKRRRVLGRAQMPSPAGFDVLKGPDGAYLLGPDGAFLLGPNLPSSAKSAIVSVDLTSLGSTIPADFVSISAEVGDFASRGMYQSTTGSMGSYIGCLSLLGSNGKFRIGGGSSNTATTPAFAQVNANSLASFLAAVGSGWSLIYGLDLVANDSSTAATQAGYLNNAFGTKAIFQMCNEPFTGGSFTVGNYQTAWNSYYTAITGAVAAAKFGACDDNNQTTSQTAIPGLTPGLAGLSLVSIHNYSAVGGNGTVTDWPSLLASSLTTDFNIIYPYTSAGGIPLILSETNSLSNGGQLGISDRLMAQAWFINNAIRTAKIGWAGMCVHSTYSFNGGQGVYNPLVQQGNGNFKPSPVFYGMYLFSRIAGKQIAASTQGGTAYINSIAVKQANNQAAILVVNNENSNTAYIKPMQSAAWATATVLLSRDGDGAGATSASPILGGQAIGESGVWSGTTFTINNGDTVAIPPCGAALISIQ
ncbi:cellulase family glycosylhydrolase [Bradyrhizobium sp. BR 10261]|uniref:cellulase family glycosylhydrolase n=1 Tax=Bradyrhizobium sp. BR 10261 TaxID=2749992 RepID=UPI001C64D9E5|nr:cellulase family glycosylhydrolase [Bradyrhizobium sp. BR 10261]MBW7967571.1 cellulase family glycosylhydrolase [Bradyrhizobium sp. BR 10261]